MKGPVVLPLPWERRDFELFLPQFPAGKEDSSGKVGGEGCYSDVIPIYATAGLFPVHYSSCGIL